jgi:integrase
MESVSALKLSHFDWVEDHLIVEEQTTKTDQTGSHKFPKAVYANPLEPNICPILAIALHVFVNLQSNSDLFHGTGQDDRYSKLMHEVVGGLSEAELAFCNIVVPLFGTHSIRKGACTYCKDVPEGPNDDMIELRMGHSVGKVREAYVYRHKARNLKLCFKILSNVLKHQLMI